MRHPVADLGRRDRERLEREELDAVRPGKRREHLVEHTLRIAGPGGDPEACQLEHSLRRFPGEEGREFVGADEEDGVVERERLERVDRPRKRVERHIHPADARESDPGQSQPVGRTPRPPL